MAKKNTKKVSKKNSHKGSSFDSFLKAEGLYQEVKEGAQQRTKNLGIKTSSILNNVKNFVTENNKIKQALSKIDKLPSDWFNNTLSAEDCQEIENLLEQKIQEQAEYGEDEEVERLSSIQNKIVKLKQSL